MMLQIVTNTDGVRKLYLYFHYPKSELYMLVFIIAFPKERVVFVGVYICISQEVSLSHQAERGGLYLLVHQEGPVHWFIVYFIVLYSLCFLVQCAPNYTIIDKSLIIPLLGKSTMVETHLSCFCFVF